MMKYCLVLFIVLFSYELYCQTPPDWLWAIQTQGTGGDHGYSIATDSMGNSYVTGSFSGTMTIGSFVLNSNGGSEVYVAKVTDAGEVIWAIQVGGTGNEECYAIAVDSSANIYLTGFYKSTSLAFGSVILTSVSSSIDCRIKAFQFCS